MDMATNLSSANNSFSKAACFWDSASAAMFGDGRGRGKGGMAVVMEVELLLCIKI
jgi:hypothetical protein